MTPEGKRLERAIRWSKTVTLLRQRIDELQAEIRQELIEARHAVLEAESVEQDIHAVTGRR